MMRVLHDFFCFLDLIYLSTFQVLIVIFILSWTLFPNKNHLCVWDDVCHSVFDISSVPKHLDSCFYTTLETFTKICRIVQIFNYADPQPSLCYMRS
jgi:hypothetical protein